MFLPFDHLVELLQLLTDTQATVDGAHNLERHEVVGNLVEAALLVEQFELPYQQVDFGLLGPDSRKKPGQGRPVYRHDPSQLLVQPEKITLAEERVNIDESEITFRPILDEPGRGIR